MKLQVIGSNQTLVQIHNQEYFFSYDTCVAGRDDSGDYWKVDHKYSNTTSRHVNSYLNGQTPELVSVSDVELVMNHL